MKENKLNVKYREEGEGWQQDQDFLTAGDTSLICGVIVGTNLQTKTFKRSFNLQIQTVLMQPLSGRNLYHKCSE